MSSRSPSWSRTIAVLGTVTAFYGVLTAFSLSPSGQDQLEDPASSRTTQQANVLVLKYVEDQRNWYAKHSAQYRWGAYALYASEIALAITAAVAALNEDWPRWYPAVPALLIPFISLMMARWQVPQRHVSYALAREAINEELTVRQLGACDYRGRSAEEADDLLISRVLASMREERAVWKAGALEAAKVAVPNSASKDK